MTAEKSFPADWVEEEPERFSPFVRNDSHMNWAERFIATVHLLFAPLRIAVFLGTLSAFGLYLRLRLGSAPETSNLAMPTQHALRRQYRQFTRIWLAMLGYPRVKVRGHLPLDHVGLIAVNHTSYVDVFVLSAVFGASYVSRAFVRKVPLMGTLAAGFDGIFVPEAERSGGGTGSVRAVQRMIRERLQSLEDKVFPLVVFPEGTTTNGSCLLSFRLGAFSVPCDVLPVHIRYSAPRWFSPGYESIGAMRHLFCLLMSWNQEVVVTVLPIQKADADLSRAERAALCEEAISQAGSMPRNRTAKFADKLAYLKRLRGPGETRISEQEAWKKADGSLSRFAPLRLRSQASPACETRSACEADS